MKAILKSIASVITILILKACVLFGKKTPVPVVGRLNFCEKLWDLQNRLLGKDRKVYTPLDEAYFTLLDEYDKSTYDLFDEMYEEAEEDEYFFLDDIYFGTEEPIDFAEEELEVESLEERREKSLRKYDVLYGEDLSLYEEGPFFGRDRAAELATKFYEAHPAKDYEDTYARDLAIKLLNFLEWTPRTEFSYGEIQARLDY